MTGSIHHLPALSNWAKVLIMQSRREWGQVRSFKCRWEGRGDGREREKSSGRQLMVWPISRKDEKLCQHIGIELRLIPVMNDWRKP